MAADAKLEVFVLSYNRGPHLANVLESVVRHIPWARLTVLDDGSVDSATVAALEDHEKRGARIIRRSPAPRSERRGRLWANSDMILHELARETPLALLLHDDMQVIRDVGEGEVALWNQLLSQSTSPFLSPTLKKHESRWGFLEERGLHFILHPSGRGRGWSDVVIFDVERVKSSGWHLADTEGASDVTGFERFGLHPVIPYPFVAYVPLPPSNTARGISLFSERWLERRNSGFFPFRPLDANEVEAFLAESPRADRPPSVDRLLRIDAKRAVGRMPSPPYRELSHRPGTTFERVVYRTELSLRRALHFYFKQPALRIGALWERRTAGLREGRSNTRS